MAERKRSPDQIREHRARIADLVLKHYTHQEIAGILEDETGISLSRRQITYDVGKIRDAWLERQHKSYDALINEELARIDSLEGELWRTLRDSRDDHVRKMVEEVAQVAGDKDVSPREYEMRVRKILTTTESARAPTGIFAQIIECHKERRRLLGLYAPANINVNKKLEIKAYSVVSPDDWDDDVIEGEVAEPRQLPSGE